MCYSFCRRRHDSDGALTHCGKALPEHVLFHKLPAVQGIGDAEKPFSMPVTMFLQIY